jgi:hypothetical protein
MKHDSFRINAILARLEKSASAFFANYERSSREDHRRENRRIKLECAGLVLLVFTTLATVSALGVAIKGAIIAQRAFVASTQAVGEAKRQADEAKRQADAAESQIDVAKDTEKRELRAYVYVVPKIVDFVAGGQPYAEITLKNGGQTPAYDAVISINQKIDSFPQTLLSKMSECNRLQSRRNATEAASSIKITNTRSVRVQGGCFHSKTTTMSQLERPADCMYGDACSIWTPSTIPTI